MKETPFRNATAYAFVDLSEQYREYTFPGSTKKVRIARPRKLYVSPSGGHRIFSADGVSHYIPPNWIHLEWKVEKDAPHFLA